MSAAFLWVLAIKVWLLALMCTVLSVGLAAAYLRLMWKIYVEPDFADRSTTEPARAEAIDALLERVDRFASITDAQAVRFIYLSTRPQEYFDRISESVEALTRSFSITTTATLRLPTTARETVVVPLLLRGRGTVEDGMRFVGPKGDRLSSMTRLDTVAYTLAVTRRAVQSWGPIPYSKYLGQLERYLASLLFYDGVADPSYLSTAIEAIRELETDSPQFERDAVAKFLATYYKREPICVAVPIEDMTTRFDSGATAPRFAEVSDEITRAAESRHRSAVAEEERGSSQPTYERTLRLSARRRIIAEFHYDSTHSRKTAPRAIDRIRVVFGIRPTLISVPLVNAERAASYHLEVIGPENTYLARQSTPNPSAPSAAISGHVVGPKRLGQRHAHLYIRSASKTEDFVYNTQYYERMPGSMGSAAASAGSVTVLVWLAFFAVLSGRGVLFDNWEFAALVLAFPSAIGLWLGVQTERRIGEGVLAARVSSVATVGLAAIAAWFSIMLGDASHKQAWLVLALLATLNAIAPVVSWYQRARLQSHFVEARD
ncbi:MULTISPECIES: hypothetical protein [unclassified Leifsonia]|uniref:hypothetical protein n=1 Tax=unclassified Leifsonia TaxID=2663824 RepID=UPI001113D645|nr:MULTISPECIES: hypothetical protein [unclassified Leifsonia]